MHRYREREKTQKQHRLESLCSREGFLDDTSTQKHEDHRPELRIVAAITSLSQLFGVLRDQRRVRPATLMMRTRTTMEGRIGDSDRNPWTIRFRFRVSAVPTQTRSDNALQWVNTGAAGKSRLSHTPPIACSRASFPTISCPQGTPAGAAGSRLRRACPGGARRR
jgi:hypothetical protein